MSTNTLQQTYRLLEEMIKDDTNDFLYPSRDKSEQTPNALHNSKDMILISRRQHFLAAFAVTYTNVF